MWDLLAQSERLFLNHTKTLGFLATGGEEFNLGPETRLDRSELLCDKILLKYKGDMEKEYVKAIYCHPAYLTFMQSTSRETLGWKKHKL